MACVDDGVPGRAARGIGGTRGAGRRYVEVSDGPRLSGDCAERQQACRQDQRHCDLAHALSFRKYSVRAGTPGGDASKSLSGVHYLLPEPLSLTFPHEAES